MQARFSGFCKAGSDRVKVGDSLTKRNGSWVHVACASGGRTRCDGHPDGGPMGVTAYCDGSCGGRGFYVAPPPAAPPFDFDSAGDDPWEDQRARRDEYEYQQGRADGERFAAEKKIYGAGLAEMFQAQDEFNRYWKNGEDY